MFNNMKMLPITWKCCHGHWQVSPRTRMSVYGHVGDPWLWGICHVLVTIGPVQWLWGTGKETRWWLISPLKHKLTLVTLDTLCLWVFLEGGLVYQIINLRHVHSLWSQGHGPTHTITMTCESLATTHKMPNLPSGCFLMYYSLLFMQ